MRETAGETGVRNCCLTALIFVGYRETQKRLSFKAFARISHRLTTRG